MQSLHMQIFDVVFDVCVEDSACLAGVRKGVWGGGEVGYDIVPFRRERKCPCNEIGI